MGAVVCCEEEERKMIKTKKKTVRVDLGESLLVEQTILDFKDYPTSEQVYNRVKNRISYDKFNTIMDRLESARKIHYEPTGEITWTYHPELAKISVPFRMTKIKKKATQLTPAQLKSIKEINAMFCYRHRDPKRIKRILGLIEDVWIKYPDMRFGQLLIALKVAPFKRYRGGMTFDFFNVEDDVNEARLLEGIKRLSNATYSRRGRGKRAVTAEEIAKNDGDLSPSRYVSKAKKGRKK
jgi:hypothetical protein